jgi:hypothetical protein
MARLRALLGKNHVRLKNEPVQYGRMPPWRLVLHAVHFYEAFEILDELCRTRRVVCNRLDVALDVMTDTTTRAQELYRRADEFFVKPWNGQHAVRRKRRLAVRYTRPFRWGRVVVGMYADRLSKISGRPCLHLEWKVTGKLQVASLGVVNTDGAFSLDLTQFWKRRLRFEKPDPISLAQQWARLGPARHGRPKRTAAEAEWLRRAGHLLLRRYRRHGEPLPAQDLRRRFNHEGLRAERIMRKLDVSALLPRLQDCVCYPSHSGT